MRCPPFWRWLTLVTLALAVGLLPVGGPTAALAAPALAQPAASFEAWFDVEQPPPVPFELVQMIVDFPGGARVGRHTHGGPGYVTMLEHELTMSIGDTPVRAYGAGESFVEPFRVVASGAHLGATPSSVLVTYRLPVGAPVTTLVQTDPSDPTSPASALPAGQLPPGAAPRFESRLRLEQAPAGYRLGQMLRTYEPGAWTMSEMASAPRLLTVVSGAVLVLTGPGEQTYGAGEQWTELPGQAFLSGNPGTNPAVVAVSVVGPSR
jgi:quercetin dioxygenase-like cupin family protein